MHQIVSLAQTGRPGKKGAVVALGNRFLRHRATRGGTLFYHKLAPTREKADQLVDARLAAPMNADANDFIWAWESSADYDAAPGLERIEAPLLAINSADDERDPPESGLEEAALKRVKNGKLYLIPASDETRGHLTTGIGEVLLTAATAIAPDGVSKANVE